ncbi:hypothetical protein SAMN05444392_10887 [Seinonella peptonophila]|uniref:Haemolysin XhlA n=1 Tax=Seinonella peptonophila TaxID=112248 RepID=A0A1M4Z8D7_9BACL|nr:hypothetical protein [Seinonella peptonophila]SHF14022.1 hypothetical protein SAMN05444392_10887 [Seinonella peptonophila]
MMKEKGGVVISIEDIYFALQEIKTDVSTVKSEVKNLRETDERSREALELAKDAMAKAVELEKQVEKIDARQQWLQGLFLTAILGIGSLLFTLN